MASHFSPIADLVRNLFAQDGQLFYQIYSISSDHVNDEEMGNITSSHVLRAIIASYTKPETKKISCLPPSSINFFYSCFSGAIYKKQKIMQIQECYLIKTRFRFDKSPFNVQSFCPEERKRIEMLSKPSIS